MTSCSTYVSQAATHNASRPDRILDSIREKWYIYETDQPQIKEMKENNNKKLKQILTFLPHQGEYHWETMQKVLELYFKNQNNFLNNAIEEAAKIIIPNEISLAEKAKEKKAIFTRYVLQVDAAAKAVNI